MWKQRSTQTPPALAVALTLLLTACGSSPDRQAAAQYGIYIIDGSDLVRMDGDPEWERQTWDRRASLEPDVKLAINDPLLSGGRNLSELRELILLERVAHVRNAVDVRTGARAEASGNRWMASHLQRFAVPITFGPDPDYPGLIRVRPREPLPPGLYSIMVGGGRAATLARFGVSWEAVNKQAYADRHCVDRYDAGPNTAFFGCGEEPIASAAGLSIGGLTTEQRDVAGIPTLVVAGRIANGTDVPRRIPPLRAKLVSGTGVEQSWNFQINRAYILPGETIDFSSTVQYPMENSENVVVSFSSPSAS